MKKEYKGIFFTVKAVQDDVILSSGEVVNLDNDISLQDWIDE